MFNPFKKKTLSSILAVFIDAVDDLRELASKKQAEAAKKDAQVDSLLDEIVALEEEADEASMAANRIEEMIGSSTVLSVEAEAL